MWRWCCRTAGCRRWCCGTERHPDDNNNSTVRGKKWGFREYFLLQQRQKQRTADTKTRVGGRKNANDKNTVHVPSVQISLWAHCSENLTESCLFLMLLLTANVTLFYAAPLLCIIITNNSQYFTFTTGESYLHHVHFTHGEEDKNSKKKKQSISCFIKQFSLFSLLCRCASDLRYNPQCLPQAVKADVSDILPRYVDVPLLGLKEAEQQPHNGALPATRRGTNRQHHSVCKLYPPQSTDNIWW